MVVHNGAAMVIARRSYGKIEKVPKLLKSKFITDTKKFDSKNEWARWAMISKLLLNRTNYTNAVLKELSEMNIENKNMKGGTGFVANRKTILGAD